MLACSAACTGAPIAVTRITGLSSPSTRPASGTTIWAPGATTSSLPPAGTCAPAAPKTVSCTDAGTVPGLASRTTSVAPVAADPPTSQDSIRAGRHADAAKPRRSSAETVEEPDAATSVRAPSFGCAITDVAGAVPSAAGERAAASSEQERPARRRS